jgi:hypothetical protein
MPARAPCVALLAFAASLLIHGVSRADPSAAFDRAAALQAINGVDLASCRVKHGGDGHVTITFDASGAASDAIVDRGTFVDTRPGRCIAKKFRKVKVPSFDGPPVRVGKNFHID